MAIKKAGWQDPERSRRMPDNVCPVWYQLAGKYSNNAALTDRFLGEIERKYTSSRRHYHNLHHIQALLQLCDTYAGQLHDRDIMEFSIFYHDVIYNVLRKDNEFRSAGLAVKRLQALQVPAEQIVQVKLFIEATQTHTVTGGVKHPTDLQLFLDFDMSILGAAWEDYEAYTRQVRREYRIYPDKLYNAGRKQFLQHCLQSAHIFQTPAFRERYEVIARENMARELREY